MDGRLFAWFEGDSFEAFWFANRAGGPSRALLEVELDDFVTRECAGVRYVDRGFCAAHVEIADGELCVAEAVAEGVERQLG